MEVRRMFIAISDSVFVNAEYISGIRIEEFFLADGERWYVHLYGSFDLPPELLERDGSILVGPFKTKQQAIESIFSSSQEIVFEAEQ